MLDYTATTKYHEFITTVCDRVQEGIIVFSASGYVILVNASACQMLSLNYSPDIRQQIYGLIPIGPVKKIIETYLHEKKSNSGRYTEQVSFKGEDDRLTTVEVTLEKTALTDGEVLHVLSVRDRVSPDKINLMAGSYKKIFQRLDKALFILGKNLTVKDCNKCALRLLGVARDDLMNKPIGNVVIFDGAENNKDADALAGIASSAGFWTGSVGVKNNENRLIKYKAALFTCASESEEGHYFGLALSKSLNAEGDGKAAISLETSDNMSAKRKGALAQNASSHGLTTGLMLEVKDLFMALSVDLDHVFHNLSNVSAVTKAMETTDLSLTTCQKIKLILEEIKVQTKDFKDEGVPFDIAQAIQAALSLVRLIQPETVELETALDSDVGLVKGHKLHISQIILNLVSNSLSFNGGQCDRISVKLEKTNSNTIDKSPKLYRLKPDHTYARLELRDNAGELSDFMMGGLLDPFFAPKVTEDGLGVCLAEVATLLRGLSGAIDVVGAGHQGTCYILYFPIHGEEVEDGTDGAQSVPGALICNE